MQYISMDIDEKKAMKKEDLRRLSFGEASFDAVFISHVLEHIDDDRTAMSEMYRVLRPGGWALVMVPMLPNDTYESYEDSSIRRPEERAKHFGQSNHVRFYGLDIVDRLTEAGFKVSTFRYPEDFSTITHVLKETLGMPKRDFIFFCEKLESTQ